MNPGVASYLFLEFVLRHKERDWFYQVNTDPFSVTSRTRQYMDTATPDNFADDERFCQRHAGRPRHWGKRKPK